MQMLKDQAYEVLLKMIKDGQLEYGKIYSLNALSSEMNMSRTPVRDAIQRICDEGRMDMLPSRGFRLHFMTREELIQHYHFSNAIEGYCVSTLAKKYREGKGKDHVMKMQFLVDELGKRISEETPFQDYFTYDRDFHLAILESLEDPYFSSLQHSSMGFYGHPELQHDNAIAREAIYACHQKILDHIEKGDPEGAYNALIEHSDLMIKDII